jgi:vacuolar-type H+-ATPase subunit E/Vma4
MSNENKQTAVEWLMNQAVAWVTNTNNGNYHIEFPKDAIEQAKEMEKENIKIAFASGKLDAAQEIFKGIQSKKGKEYYEQTYGGNK